MCHFLLNYATKDKKRAISKTRTVPVQSNTARRSKAAISRTHKHSYWWMHANIQPSLQSTSPLSWLTALITTGDDEHSTALMFLSGPAKKADGGHARREGSIPQALSGNLEHCANLDFKFWTSLSVASVQCWNEETNKNNNNSKKRFDCLLFSSP